MKWLENLVNKLVEKLRRKKRSNQIAVITDERPPVAVVATKHVFEDICTRKREEKEEREKEWYLRQELPSRSLRYTPPKPGRQAITKDYGKFMKHGRQSKEYRASVKAKKKPEEED